MTASKHLSVNKSHVEDALKKYPNTRTSDKMLYAAVLEDSFELSSYIGSTAYLKLCKFLSKPEVPSMETVARIRRRFQADGQYDAKDNGRKHIEKEFRELIR